MASVFFKSIKYKNSKRPIDSINLNCNTQRRIKTLICQHMVYHLIQISHLSVHEHKTMRESNHGM